MRKQTGLFLLLSSECWPSSIKSLFQYLAFLRDTGAGVDPLIQKGLNTGHKSFGLNFCECVPTSNFRILINGSHSWSIFCHIYIFPCESFTTCPNSLNINLSHTECCECKLSRNLGFVSFSRLVGDQEMPPRRQVGPLSALALAQVKPLV